MSQSRRAHHWLRIRSNGMIALWVGWTFVASSLLSNRLDSFWNNWLETIPLWISMLILAASFLVLFWSLWRGGETLLVRIRADASTLSEADLREQSQRENVVMGLSLAFKPNFEGTEALLAAIDDFQEKLRVEGGLGTDGGLAAACENPARSVFDNWQQPLRLIHALPHLKRLYVIENTKEQFEMFKAMIGRFLPDMIVSRIEDAGGRSNRHPYTLTVNGKPCRPDYEDFDYVISAIARGRKMIAKDAGLTPDTVEETMLIDATAGQKTTSIAAAIASLNRPTMFVYVNHDGVLKGYDAELRPPAWLE